MKDLESRVAVVTGAAGAVGRALALALAAEGMSIVVSDVDSARLDLVAKELEAGGAPCVAIAADVSDAVSVATLAGGVRERFGGVDLLCNNAAILRAGASWEQPLDEWAAVIGINVMGAITMVHEFAPAMIESDRDSHIVNTIGSIALYTSAFAPPASYAVSKHALLAYTESLSMELTAIGARVGVSALLPSGVKSDIALAQDIDDPAFARPEVKAAFARLQSSIAAGLEPEFIAARTVEAVKANRFWIFPHENHEERLAHRTDYIARQSTPTPFRFQPPPSEAAPQEMVSK